MPRLICSAATPRGPLNNYRLHLVTKLPPNSGLSTCAAQAYLKLKQGTEAATEFQKILDHRGQAPLSPLYPLAHLGLARSAALAGDLAKSRAAYEEFFKMWKSADADLPILIDAKREYEKHW